MEEDEDRETGRRRCPKHCRAKEEEEEEEEEELLEKTRRNDEDGDGVVVMIFLFERQKARFFFCKSRAYRASFGDPKKKNSALAGDGPGRCVMCVGGWTLSLCKTYLLLHTQYTKNQTSLSSR